MSYRIEFKKGSGLNPEYANVPLFNDLEYSTNIVGALTQSAVTGDNKPLCEPWFDKASKQLWVDKQVINPKIIADDTEGHTGIEIGDVYWDQLMGATLKIGLNQSLLPAAVTNELITGTEASSITTEVARYNPHSSTVDAPYSPLNAIYFGDGLTYTVVNGVGVLSCALLDTFVNSASYDPLSYTLTISLTTGDTFDIDLASLIDDTHAPAFGRIQTDNLPVTTAVYKNTGVAQATISEDSLQLIGGNKWIEAGVYTVGNYKSIRLGHALSSVEPTTDHLNKKTTVKEYSYDAAGHITGETTFDIDFSQGVIDTYYSALYTLYANGELVKGAMYRITDYETTTIQAYTNVAHHDFDLVVTAISESELSPKAYAIQKSGDTYFSTYNADLSKWEIWYDINNDQDKYMWADPINGKGVIYRMIDEYENDCPYDFKNILFERRLTNGGLDVDDGIDTNVYTFNLYFLGTNTVGDASVIQPQNSAQNYFYTRNNVIGTFWYNAKGQNDKDIRKLNNIVFLSVANLNGEASLSYLNVFGINCENNTIGADCNSNTFGDYCSNNVFGDFCQNNTLGSYCMNNTFGYNCQFNVIHNHLTNSTFGDVCSKNTIDTTCNKITFGDSDIENCIGTHCSYITLSDYCSRNKIGTECDYITFGNQSNQYGTYIQDVIINSDNHNINIYNDGTADASHYLQHIYIAQGFSTGSQIDIISVARGNNFRTTISRASNGDIRTYNEDDPIPAQIQSDWNEADSTSLAYILNKPTIPEQVALYEEVTYAQLVSKVNNDTLEKGKYYRITDYVTTTSQMNTRSAGHQFDVVVTAKSESALYPEATALLHSGDTYFSSNNVDINKWRIWYDIENSTDKYIWADATNGKGVIYRMIDEFGNDCAYDFKNIQFNRKLTDGVLDNDEGTNTWVYTFTVYDANNDSIKDSSIPNIVNDELYVSKYNIINVGLEDSLDLTNNVFLNKIRNNSGFYNEFNVLGFDCFGNTFGNSCSNNIFDRGCSNNIFGVSSSNNILKSYCFSNTFGNSCYYNTLGIRCYSNKFGNNCTTNTFDQECNTNKFGDNCSSNTFFSNSHGNTFGNNCTCNKFGHTCYFNTFGNYCEWNILENRCLGIIFGDSNKQYGDYIRNVTIGSYNQYINIYNSGTADSSHYLQNIVIASGMTITNTSSIRTNISTITRGNNYRTTVAKLSDGTLRIYKEDEDDKNVQSDWNQSDNTADDYIKNKPTIPTLRTMNHEQLTDSTLGDINIHDGYYFPNAVQDYDGNWYGAVVIGDQVWMAENIRSTHYSDGTAITSGGTNLSSTSTPYYYNYTSSSIPIEERGLLYNWAAVMNGASPSNINPSGVVGLAPGTQAKGDNIWHIPSSQEFSALTTYLGKQKRFIFLDNNAYIGKSVASSKYWTVSASDYAVGNDLTINNKSGFNAIPAGIFNASYIGTVTPPISGQYESVNFWTTSQNNSTTSYTRSVSYSSYRGLQAQSAQKINGYSVRCVSDLDPVQFRNWYIAQYGSLQHHITNSAAVTFRQW